VSGLFSLLIGYLFGLFQTGYIYGKYKKVDIREHGSGNTGTTNTLRTLGWKAGAVTFIGDCGKAILAILVVWLLFHNSMPEQIKVLEMTAGLGTFLGHIFPCYMKFKGGKGIACTVGVLIAFFPLMLPISLGLFFVIVGITRYVSVGSIAILISFYIQLLIFGQTGILGVTAEYLPPVYIIGAVFIIFGIAKHKENIKRLMNGTENKLKLSKKQGEETA
jgi:glycerol-3-phosphate acyltransferase PlsY